MRTHQLANDIFAYRGPTQGFDSSTAIAKLKSLGIPSSKLLLGIGFYGRGWAGVSQSAPGGSATGPAPGTYEQGIEAAKKNLRLLLVDQLPDPRRGGLLVKLDQRPAPPDVRLPQSEPAHIRPPRPEPEPGGSVSSSNSWPVAPATARNRLFLSASSERGSCSTSVQCFRLMAANARAPGTMT